VVAAHGVQGQLRLQSYTEPPANLLDYKPWILVQDGREQLIERPSGRQAGQVLVIGVPGVTERDGAMALVGAEVYVERASLPKAAPGEYYWSDLEGLEVVTIEGTSLGRVSHLFATGANDVMVVKGERQRLIPFLPDQVVRGVDLGAGRIEVDWDPEF
jgi:16S rRNA processing protein RimM